MIMPVRPGYDLLDTRPSQALSIDAQHVLYRQLREIAIHLRRHRGSQLERPHEVLVRGNLDRHASLPPLAKANEVETGEGGRRPAKRPAWTPAAPLLAGHDVSARAAGAVPALG